jgi:hypothetical protein
VKEERLLVPDKEVIESEVDLGNVDRNAVNVRDNFMYLGGIIAADPLRKSSSTG